MKKRRKTKKSRFFAKHMKCFLSPKFLVIAAVLAGLAVLAATYKMVYEKNFTVFGEQTAVISEKAEVSGAIASAAPVIFLASESSSSAVTSSPNLRDGVAVYVMSKKTGPCRDYRNTVLPNVFSMRCKSASALWRGMWVKKIDVAGYSKLRLKASLKVNDYTDYFAECGHKGVNRDDFTDLIVLSSDPRPKLDAECNHVVGEEKWSDCSVSFKDPSAVKHCGVPKCSSGKSCDMEMDVSGRDAVYLLFSVSDAWAADIEGDLSGVEVTLTK